MDTAIQAMDMQKISANAPDGKYYSKREVKKISIIIPAYNEEKSIRFLLDKIAEVKLINQIEKEIIIVNDFSTDLTDMVVKDYMSENTEISIVYITHPINKGKGAAIHTGIRLATGEYLLVQDADLEYDPQDYNTLLKPILNGFADVVYGSRFMG